MSRPALNVLLAIGFLGVAGAVAVASGAPPTGYEPSIYEGTPTLFWLGIGVAFAVALPTALVCRGRRQGLGIALGSSAAVAVVALPAIRGYRFSGMGDALTHLGWTRDFLGAEMFPHELFYPGLHSFAAILSRVGGIGPERALLFGVVFLFVPFVLFVPLAVRALGGGPSAVGLGAIVSWFVLPINNVATHTGVHTNSNALFYVPVVLFAILAYLRRRDDRERLFGLSPFGLLVVASGIGLLLVHPQQMINVVVVLASISLVQLLARWRLEDGPFLEHPTAYAHTAVLGGVFLVWSVANERFRQAASGLVYGILTYDVGASGEVEQRETSLAEIGGSLPELFGKLFLVSALVGLAVGLFVLLTWLGVTDVDRERKALVTYFGVALVPLSAIFLVYFVGTPTMAFRQVGFIYVLVTILAGLALAHGRGWLAGGISTPGADTVVSLVLAGCLVLALATVFASPFIYTPSQHVTDQKVSGYESSFEHGGDRLYAGFGFGVARYADGIHGVESPDRERYEQLSDGVVDPEAFENGNYSGAYEGFDYYFVSTSYDESREFDVYGELHHTERALSGIDAEPNADRVVSNEEFRMYAVDGVD